MPTKRLKTQPAVLALAVAAFAATTDANTGVSSYSLPVLPAGGASVPVDNRFDGRSLLHDNAAIAAAFNAKGRKVPVDIGHLTEWDGAAPAFGWVTALYVAEDGSLWANCELTAEGMALVDGKKFGYTSPTLRGVFTENGDWMALSVKSLALTNNPALEMSSTFTAEGEDETDEDDAAAEGTVALTAEAPAEPAAPTDAPLAAEQTASLAAAPSVETVALADFTALQGTLTTLTTERDTARAEVTSLTQRAETLTAEVAALTSARDAETTRAAAAETALSQLQAAQAEAAVVAAVDASLTAGHFTVTAREHLLKQARYDLAGFKALVASMRPNPAFGALPTQGTEAETFGLTVEQLAHCKRVGISPESYAASLAELSS